MNIRNLLFIMMGTAGALSVTAQEAGKLKLVYADEAIVKLKPVETTNATVNPSVSMPEHHIMALQTPSDATIQNKRPIRKAGAEKPGLKLDSIIFVNADGTNATIIRSQYNEQGKEIKRENCYWNTRTKSWDKPAETYEYTWSGDGLILSEQAIGYGTGKRIDYEYDDRGRGIVKTYYQYDDKNQWQPTSRGEYTYDDNDNVIEEYISTYTNNAWVYTNHNYATWDAGKRQTSVTLYVWDGSSWQGTRKETYVWFDGPRDPDYVDGTNADRMTYKGSYLWVNGEWKQYYIFTNSFNSDGRLTGQSEQYYNRTFGKWSGGDTWDGLLGQNFTWKGVHTLDDEGNTVSVETFRCLPDSSSWISLGIATYDWIYEEDGSRSGEMKSINYTYNENWEKTGEVLNQTAMYGYNAANRKTWVLQRVPGDDGQMKDLFEEKYTYNENNQITSSYVWDWKDGERKNTLNNNYTYDTEGNLTEVTSRTSESGGIQPIGAPAFRGPAIDENDEKGWVNSSKWTYSYENNTLTEKYGYRWKNNQWATSSGQTVDYDWNYPADEVALPNGWTDPYKINSLSILTGDGNGGWLSAVRTYYYSVSAPAGISTTDNGISDIPYTLSGDELSIQAPGEVNVNIYSINGTKVASTTQKVISVKSMTPGLYIADVNGHIIKIIKK